MGWEPLFNLITYSPSYIPNHIIYLVALTTLLYKLTLRFLKNIFLEETSNASPHFVQPHVILYFIFTKNPLFFWTQNECLYVFSYLLNCMCMFLCIYFHCHPDYHRQPTIRVSSNWSLNRLSVYILLLLTLFYDKRVLDIGLNVGTGPIVLWYNRANYMMLLIYSFYSNSFFSVYDYYYTTHSYLLSVAQPGKKKRSLCRSSSYLFCLWYRFTGSFAQ